MKRKVNLVGQNTHTVSLPTKWVKQNNIKKGDELEILEEGKNLKIIINGNNEKRELFLNIGRLDHFMDRLVCAPYLKGYNSILIKYEDPRIYAKILGALKHTINFEVVEQKEGKCKLEEISRGINENFNKLIMRLFYILNLYSSELNKFLKKPHKNLNDFLELEYSCDRLALYCRRLINKDIVSGKTYDNTAMYHIVCLAEQVGDQIDEIIKIFKRINYKDYKYDKRLDKIFDNVDKTLKITFKKIDNFFNKKDQIKQIEFALEQRKIRQDMIYNKEKDFLKFKKENLIIYHHLINTIELIQHMSEELF